ncbi:Uu.00g037680.m01.CDS01 [Anthostomella pinea]|uniref:Uu.00g037680.m01.CDS01 n=1 Tax=Anthostomella pinea TaxID=933095 RepID=A0AAI8V9N1_9PEZI|nr:Uu.00g037680.m01.CDS01 [Anthostomella pinea]
MYARGILFGKMQYELGDHSVVKCPELGLTAEIDFKTKGWVSGTYNALGGTIRNEQTGEALFELSGLWSEEMTIKDLRNGKKDTFFDARRARPSKPQVRPLEEQDERESQKLWQKTAQAVKEKNHEVATDEKTKIEDKQREEAASRATGGVDWHPRLFRAVRADIDGEGADMEKLEWIINAQIDGATPEKQAEQVMGIYPIIPGQNTRERNIVPPNASAGNPKTAGKPASDDRPGDLIDFGQISQNDDAASAPKLDSKPATNIHDTSTNANSIHDMLESTGHKSDGPLIDFTGDMKKDLPPAKGPPPAMKRTETEESSDAFYDAQS